MTNPPLWVSGSKLTSNCSSIGENQMAGISAGLVAGADMNSQAGQGSTAGSQPAHWSMIWFLIAVTYLVGIYYGMITINARGV